MRQFDFTDRRTVLKTIGAGIGTSTMSGVASAGPPGDDEKGGKGAPYGNGNALGKFLNEEALYKASPVWDTGVADRTGQSEVNVLWSNPTSTDADSPKIPDPGPWGIEPRVVKVSPGTEVTWTWYDGPGAIDIHHLVSYFNPPYDEPFELPPELIPGEEGDGHAHEHPGGADEFFVKEELGESFSYYFDELGTYFYFCVPHGVPSGVSFKSPNGKTMDPPNLFGQRGAVKVVDD